MAWGAIADGDVPGVKICLPAEIIVAFCPARSAGQVFPVFNPAAATGKDLPQIEISNPLPISF